MNMQLDARQRAMLAEMGVHVWAPESVMPPDAAPLVEPVEPRREVSPMDKPVITSTKADPAPLASLDGQALGQAAASCQDCGLCAGRTKSTLNHLALSRAAWMVVGDPPEEEDDRAGRAFAGESGVLLDNMLGAAGASRTAPGDSGQASAYVTHVVKCRPPHGQVPQPADIAQCSRFLDREIDLVQPRILFAAGRFAIAALLKDYPDAAAKPLGKQRGSVYRYRGIPVVVSYAPQALMRNGADKAKAWADLCLALEQLERSD